MNKTLHQTFAALGIDVAHHFGGGAYIKSTKIPPHRVLEQHVHKHDHLSVLVYGRVLVTVDGVQTDHIGPEILLIKSGSAHKVEALSDVLWLCVHGTDVTDPDKVDAELIA